MSLKIFNRTIGSLVAATAIVSSYTPAVNADETNSAPNLSARKLGSGKVEVTVYSAPGSTNNFVDARNDLMEGPNIDQQWRRVASNQKADTNGVYKLTFMPAKPQEFYRAGVGQ